MTIDDCPSIIKNLEEAIEAVEEAYVDSQIEALDNIGDDLINAAGNLPPNTPPEEQLQTLCVSLGGAFDGFNSLKNSCTFDPSGCLKQVLDSGVFGGNPILAGAALAGATFIDAATGNFQPPFLVPPPTAGINTGIPALPGGSISLPDIPAPPPNDQCEDPIKDLNEAIDSAEETYLELHKKATEEFGNAIKDFTGGLGGLPTDAKINAFCLGAGAGFDAAAGLSISCKIDVSECLKQVLESGIIGGLL